MEAKAKWLAESARDAGWLTGSLKSKTPVEEKAQKPLSNHDRERAKVLRRIKAWERKKKLAITKLAKLEKIKKRLDRKETKRLVVNDPAEFILENRGE